MFVSGTPALDCHLALNHRPRPVPPNAMLTKQEITPNPGCPSHACGVGKNQDHAITPVRDIRAAFVHRNAQAKFTERPQPLFSFMIFLDDPLYARAFAECLGQNVQGLIHQLGRNGPHTAWQTGLVRLTSLMRTLQNGQGYTVPSSSSS